MLPDLRREFNRNFSAKRYQRFLRDLEARCGAEMQFRVSETPCFFSASLLNELGATGAELIHQLLDNPEYLKASDAAVPPEYKVLDEDARPLFIQVDFGLVRGENGNIEPRLVELQGFPSLYGYQPTLAQQYIESYDLGADLQVFLGGLDRDSYRQLLCRAIVGQHSPEHVILLEIDPDRQKTRADFIRTEQLCGIRTVNIRDVAKQGRKLFYSHGGKLVPIERIYNRVIVDELMRRDVRIGFDYRDRLDVEWACHPNWYFRISKFSIPHLRHHAVPRSWFLNEMERLPANLNDFVLKPLYSFAGSGVIIGPAEQEVAAIPAGLRSQFILQEKVAFEPVIDTPHGLTQAEIRMMYIWTDELRAVLPLVRMGRGKMMGVDHNRDLLWVGSSAALFRK